MATARDLIKGSLRLLGVIASGETPTAAEVADGLSALNDMIDSWSNDGFHIFEEKREEFTLTANQQTYTIGSSGNFDTERPQIIKSAKIKDSNNEIRLDMYNQEQWASIGVKDLLSTIPQVLYYNLSYPLGEINIWPKPSQANTLVLYSLKPLTRSASADTTISMPPGSLRALRYNLAVELAPEYGKSAPSEVLQIASNSKAAIQRSNVKPVYMRNEVSDLIDRKPFNWLTGE